MNHKIISNAAWIIACRIVQAVLSLIITMLTARYLGPSNYGLISYASSIVAFLVPVMQLGFSNILVQEFVQHPEKEGTIFGTVALTSFLSSLACIVGTISFACLANAGDTQTILVCSLYSLVLIFQAFEMIQYWFQANYLSKYVSIVSLIAYVALSAYRVFLLATGKNVCWFALSNALDSLLIAAALLIIYHKMGRQKLSFSWKLALEMFSRSKHYIVSSLMVTIFAQTDKIMLTLMIGEAANGYYSAAISCATMFSFVFSAIIDSARPAIFENQKHDRKAFEKSLSTLYCVIIYLSLAQSLFMTLLANPIIRILYGNSYLLAVTALQIVVWYTTFSYIGAVRNIWILAEEKQKYLWTINLSGALANIILNAILIPFWGILGAAVASLVTQIFTNVVIGYIIKPIRHNNELMFRGLDLRLVFNVALLKELLPAKKSRKD